MFAALNILGSVWGFLKDPKKLMYLAGTVLAGFLLWQIVSFVNTAIDNAALVEQQKITLQLKDAEIAIQKSLIEQKDRAIEISDAARAAEQERNAELDDIRNNVLQSGDEDDGPLAPVLADTIRSLRNR